MMAPFSRRSASSLGLAALVCCLLAMVAAPFAGATASAGRARPGVLPWDTSPLHGSRALTAVTRRPVVADSVSRSVPLGAFTPPQDILASVQALSASNAWTVGTSCASRCQTLALHWNGAVWSRVGTPNPGLGNDGLDGMGAYSATDAWAVGFEVNSKTRVYDTLILHWNGKIWSRVTSPNPGPDQYLAGVIAISPSNAWAVGATCISGCGRLSEVDHTLVVHWNGRRWSTVPAPNPSRRINGLYAVTAVSGGDVWAVGFSCASGCGGSSEVDHALAVHWNGTVWSTAKTPVTSNAYLFSVSAGSAADVWAVGYHCVASCGGYPGDDRGLTWHWNGKVWSQVPSPNPSTHIDILSGTTVISAKNAWAVGYYCILACTVGPGVDSTLILHWNGAAWSKVPSPNPAPGSDLLSDVSSVSATDAWAVGGHINTATHVEHALLVYWNGRSWSPR